MTRRSYIVTQINFKNLCCFLLFFWFQLVTSQHKTINSGWQFSEDNKTWLTVNIPHTWNNEDAFDDTSGYRRGLGYYKKQVYISSEEKNKIHYLKFNGVNQEATIYINGKLVGNHKGGYTAFNFNISKYIHYGAYNLIEVTVDNSHDIDIPTLDADFTFYGGIYRDVEIISLPKQHLSLSDFASDGFYINYKHVSHESATVEVKVLIDNVDDIKSKNKLSLSLFDEEGNEILSDVKTFDLTANSSKEIKATLPEVKNPKLWSPENPYLYHLKLTLTNDKGVVLDSKQANIGFRWTNINVEKGLFLNGKPLKLIGVNRHQDFEGYGNAVPINLQEKDIKIIKDMGANFIRFAHYPQQRELYDLCDKLGILVWTEIPVVNKVTDSKDFFETSLKMQKEHIKQYYNHPSVVMFGYMNEIFLRLAFDKTSSDEEKESLKRITVKLASQLESLTRDLAPNHITVMALHFNELYNETGIADIPMLIGWNLYFGWYHDTISDLGVFLDEQHKRFPNRTILVSEYGPGADARIFTKTPLKYDYSLNYQFLLHNGYYNQVKERDFVLGMSAWNYADFGSEFRGDAIPHVNQKGLLQYDRTPKEVYYWYKSVLDAAQPFVHVAAKYLSGLTLFGNETYPVQVYSNQKQVSVFLNDVKLQDLNIDNGIATIEIPFRTGENEIKAVSGTVKDEQTVDALRINTLDFKTFNRFGINVGAHFYFVDNERRLTFVPDQKYSKGNYGYVDGDVFNLNKNNHQGIPYNIKNSSSEPLFQTMLEGCTAYKIDIPKGSYKVDLFFVEPQIKRTNNIYSLGISEEKKINDSQRIFDVYLNDELLQSHFNMASEYPEKYGIVKSGIIKVNDDNGLIIHLKPIKEKSVISGILIEKLE